MWLQIGMQHWWFLDFRYFFYNMFTKFTSCAHAKSATCLTLVMLRVIIFWVFDENVSSITSNVSAKLLTRFMVSLFLVKFESHNITPLKTLVFMTLMHFISSPFTYPIKFPNAFQCYIPRWIICMSISLDAFTNLGPNVLVYHIIWTTNDLYLSMSVGSASLILHRVVQGPPGGFWTLMPPPVNFLYISTNFLTSFQMVIFAYKTLSSWPHF